MCVSSLSHIHSRFSDREKGVVSVDFDKWIESEHVIIGGSIVKTDISNAYRRVAATRIDSGSYSQTLARHVQKLQYLKIWGHPRRRVQKLGWEEHIGENQY